MPKKNAAEPFAPCPAFLHAWTTNNRINSYLLQNLTDGVWRAKPAKGRTIAAMAAHMHNVRILWIKSATPGTVLPDKLGETDFSRDEATTALERSSEALAGVLRESLDGDGQVRGFRPDVASFLVYLIAHDAHHRGQISLLARQLGHPLPPKIAFGMWEWGVR